MTEPCIGPNRCSSCGGEYGEHTPTCPQKTRPVTENDLTLAYWTRVAIVRGRIYQRETGLYEHTADSQEACDLAELKLLEAEYHRDLAQLRKDSPP